MATSVFGIASSYEHVRNAVTSLKGRGFAENDISVLMPDKSSTRDFAVEHHTKAPEGAATGAGTGGVLGGTVGLLAGLGTLAIPGVGPLIAAGPLLAALSGAAVGAAAGGLVGALVGMGIPKFEAKRYEGKIKSGGMLVSVHCENSDEVTKAKNVLKDNALEDITSTSEASADIKVNKYTPDKTYTS